MSSVQKLGKSEPGSTPAGGKGSRFWHKKRRYGGETFFTSSPLLLQMTGQKENCYPPSSQGLGSLLLLKNTDCAAPEVEPPRADSCCWKTQQHYFGELPSGTLCVTKMSYRGTNDFLLTLWSWRAIEETSRDSSLSRALALWGFERTKISGCRAFACNTVQL